jgi:hypothetical protein
LAIARRRSSQQEEAEDSDSSDGDLHVQKMSPGVPRCTHRLGRGWNAATRPVGSSLGAPSATRRDRATSIMFRPLRVAPGLGSCLPIGLRPIVGSYFVYRFRTSTAFVPPNPKLLLITASTRTSRAVLGT